jgi:hypothetical protein
LGSRKNYHVKATNSEIRSSGLALGLGRLVECDFGFPGASNGMTRDLGLVSQAAEQVKFKGKAKIF